MSLQNATRDFAGQHLSEDDLDEVLMGFGSAAASAHLAVCEPCEQRLSAFQTQMAQFNQASLAWSEARSNTISRDLSTHKPTPRLTLSAAWSSAAAFALVLAFGVTAGLQHAPATLEAANASTAQAGAAPDPQHEIDSDNAMLQAIDSEIATPQPTRFGLYEKTPRAATPQVSD